MKKLIAILAVMFVIAGAVFALNNDTIRLESKVEKVVPNFKISVPTKDGAQTPATFATGKDISEEDIELTFTLRQEGSVSAKDNTTKDYSKFKGTARLTVTINPFSATVNSVVETQSTTFAIQTSGTAKGAGVEDKLTTADPTIAGDAHSVEFVLTYLGKKVLDEDTTDVGTVAVKWTKDDSLPMEGNGTTYTSDVVLTYTVQ